MQNTSTNQTERYIVFIKDLNSGEEFTVAKMGKPNDYQNIQAQAESKYKYPQYQLHMVYTQADLENILSTLNRWYGPVSTSRAIAKKQADTAKVKQQLAARAEWEKLVAAHKNRQQEKQNFVQKASITQTATNTTTTITPRQAPQVKSTDALIDKMMRAKATNPAPIGKKSNWAV